MHSIISYIFSIVVLLTGSLNFCANKRNIELNNNLRAINVSYIMPIVNWDGTISEKKSFYETYFFHDLIMYKFSYNFDSTDNEKLLLREKRHYYFIFHKDSLFGYNFYTYPNPGFPNGRLMIDSVLMINTYKNNKFDSLLSSQPDSSYFDDIGNLVKIYSTHKSIEYPEVFTIYLNYTKKLNGIKETFSKRLDNVNKMKLFKIRLLAQGAYYEQYKMTMPKREFLYEMKEISMYNAEEILNYFNRYKKAHQNK